MQSGDRWGPDGGVTAAEEPEAPFRLDVRREDTMTVVAPVGEVDLLTARTLYAELLDQMHDDLRELVVDFSDVSFIDTTGLAALVKAGRRLGWTGVTMRIVNASPHAARVLTMTGVDRTIPVDSAST